MITTQHDDGSRLVVDPQGGYIEQWLVDDGTPVLFAGQIAGKRRATHVCVPNFGPDGQGYLAQHGFGRTVQWRPVTAKPGAVGLVYRQTTGPYTGLDLRLDYRLVSRGLVLGLTATNRADRPLRLSPGFHPYFVVPSTIDHSMEVNGQRYDRRHLEGTVYITGHRVTARLGHRHLTMVGEGFGRYALWCPANQADRFVCVEPTVAGNSFLTYPGPADEWLGPGRTRHWRARINIAE